MDPKKILIVDDSPHPFCGVEPSMAEKLLLAAKEPVAPAPPMTEKELYWANKGKKKDKRERIMNLLVCPPCADHKETRSRAHLGPFVNNGRGLIHENCPWQKGGVL